MPSRYSTTYGYFLSISMSLVLNLRMESLQKILDPTILSLLCLRNDGILSVPTGKPVAKSMLLKLYSTYQFTSLSGSISTLAFARFAISGSATLDPSV